MKKYILILIVAFFLPMCSSKPSEPSKTETEKETKLEVKTEPKEEILPEKETLTESKTPNTEWSKEMDELLEKAVGLAALANTKQCVKSHDEMIAYLGTHQKRLEELAGRFMKMKHTVPLNDKEAYEKKKAEEYDKKMGEAIATMAGFAKDCCNKELKQEDAWGLEEKLEFIRLLQTEK